MTQNNIIAVASGKGGVGKTWFSITLSHLIARSGRQVLLFDGDIGLANIDVQLGLSPEKDLGHVFDGKASVEDTIIHHPSGFDVVTGRSGSTRLASASLSSLDRIRGQVIELANNYDAVILDLGAGIEQYVQFLAAAASRCIVVVTDEPTSITDAYAYIKLCVTKLDNPRVSIVVNQAASQNEGRKTFAALEKACTSFLNLQPDLLGVIRKDNKVRDAIRAQKSIIEKTPGTLAATDVATISVKVMKELK